jgi:hypothetical protein
VETTPFDEHTCSSSPPFILRAIDCSTMLFRAWQSVHKVTAVVCMLDETRVVISRVVAAGNVAVVGDDMAVVFGGLQCGTGDRGMSWGVLGGVGRLLGLCWEWCSWQGSSVEQTTRSDGCVCA